MSKRTLKNRSYTPEELEMLSRAFWRVCADCDLTGAAGRAFLARALLSRFRNGVMNEDDLVDIARLIVWRRRGLGGKRHNRSPPGPRLPFNAF